LAKSYQRGRCYPAADRSPRKSLGSWVVSAHGFMEGATSRQSHTSLAATPTSPPRRSWRPPGGAGDRHGFMSEGRYRALLCLTQVAVEDPDEPSGVRIILIDGLSDVDVSPWRRCWEIRRWRSFCMRGARTWRSCAGPGVPSSTTCSTRSSPPGSPASPRSRVRQPDRLDPGRAGRQDGQLHALGRPAADGEQLSYAAEDVVHLLQLADELQRRLQKQPAGVGPGGVPATGVSHRRARPGDGLGAPAPGGPAGHAIPGVARRLPPGASAPPRRRTARWDPCCRCAAGGIAKRHPSDVRALGQIAACTSPVLRRRGDGILSAIRQGLEDPPIPREPRRNRSEPNDSR